MNEPHYLLGLDLGQSNDYSAWVVTERMAYGSDPPSYTAPYIERTRNLPYPAIVDHTATLIDSLNAQGAGRVDLVIDFTGVGRPVADMFDEKDLKLTGKLQLITITGADTVTKGERGDKRVPKRDLAAAVQVVLQSDRLHIAKGLPMASTLVAELLNFKVKISLSGHDSYGAGADWREGNHDDLVLALALGVWTGENIPIHSTVPAVSIPQRSKFESYR